MPIGNLGNYPGHGVPMIQTAEGGIFFYVYTATLRLNGYIGVLNTLVDYADTTNPLIYGTIAAIATETSYTNQVIVVDNSILGQASIAAGAYGYACYRGVTNALVFGSGSHPLYGDQLKITASLVDTSYYAFQVVANATAGVSGAINAATVAIQLENYITAAAAVKKVFLLGKPVTVAAS
jgi:hypothetical protein